MSARQHLVLRVTESQRDRLKELLFPGDGKESVCLALCGRHSTARRTILCLHSLRQIADGECLERSPTSVTWPIGPHVPFFAEAARKGMSVLKIHSHPTAYPGFSAADDVADAGILGGLANLAPNDVGHASAFMLPNGTISARVLGAGGTFKPVDEVVVVGDEIVVYGDNAIQPPSSDEAFLRTRQAFGPGTVSLLARMRVGVVGCSGTGSWVVEMLARLGVGELVLVDPDVVERKNLNRIIESTGADARDAVPKVMVFERAIKQMDLGTVVVPLRADILRREVVDTLADCDFLFGCVDSADGRDALNRIAAFYLIPYVDVGVHLQADGNGGVQQVCAAVHYLIPDGSSLLSRRVITAEQVRADAMRRRAPEQYEALRKEGYIQGAAVDSPAVVSVNGFAASHAVNEMLARVHPFRRDPNREFRHQTFSLPDGAWLKVDDGGPCPLLSKRAGRGDCQPMLDNPEIT
jgi:hypothetical protein